MMCISNNPTPWIKLGYVTYTFLPAVGLYFAIKFTNKKYKGWFLYIPPIVFSLIAIFSKNFVMGSECSTVFVMTQFSKGIVHSILYRLYYRGFIALVAFFLLIKIIKEKKYSKKKLYLIILLANSITLVSAVILTEVLPSLDIMFLSIYCEFTLIFAISAIIGAYLDRRIKRKR